MNRKSEDFCEGNADLQQLGEGGQSDRRMRVHCPHHESCPLGKNKPKNSRPRCFGLLIEVVPAAVEMVIVYKCPLSGRVMPMVIRDETIQHLEPETPEHQRLKKLLKPVKCQNCQQRVFDAHVFYGQARIHIKCHRDKKQLKYDLAETN
jgi:hypothetical protein